jgi:NDP-sugar pyrophosphorylase family protein
MKAVILAGGLGTRLRPFTEVIPKPLLPIGEGEKAVIEVQIENLKKHGFYEIFIATNYKSKYIESFLGDGQDYGVKIYFSIEEQRLGTVGPLSLLKEQLNVPFLLINGDILTKANFSDIYRFALKFEDSPLTVVTKETLTPFRFGSVETDGDYLINVEEKPDLKIEILAGIYIMKPSVFMHIPENEPFDINELILLLLKKKQKITRYLLNEYWLDIGRYDDYSKAQEDFKRFLD